MLKWWVVTEKAVSWAEQALPLRRKLLGGQTLDYGPKIAPQLPGAATRSSREFYFQPG